MAGVLTTKYAGEAFFCEQLDPGAGSRPAKALETIHSSGVLHGDIDLRNFRARGNDVTIIDFGFAKFREDFTNDDEWKTRVEKERHQLRKELEAGRELRKWVDRRFPLVGSRMLDRIEGLERMESCEVDSSLKFKICYPKLRCKSNSRFQ